MNFIKIAGSDIKGIFKNRFIRVSVIAIIIVPLLYSLLYLDAFWDPYGRLKDMPVAVVNLDHGANVDGNYQSYGQEFVDKLKDDDRVGWKFVSEEDANEGLEGNKYYAKLVITEDFSKDVASAKEGAPKQASLKFVCNEKKNFLASQVNSKVESALKEEITKSVTDTYVTGAFDNLYKVKDGMGQAADGSGQINDGLTTLNGKVPELADGTNKLNDGSNQLYNGQVDLNSGISQLNGGLGTLNNKIGPLNEGLALLNSKVPKFGRVSELNDGIIEINNRLGEVAYGNGTLSTGLGTLVNGQSVLNNGLKSLNDNSPTLVQGVGKLNNGTSTLQSAINQLYNGYTTQIYPGVSAIDDGLKQMQAGLVKGSSNLDNLSKASKDIQEAGTQVTNGFLAIKNSYTQVNEGVNKLIVASTNSAKSMDTVEQLLKAGKTEEALKIVEGINAANSKSANDIAKLKQGASDLATGIDQYNAKVSQYITGVNKLATGANTLVSNVSGISNGVSKLSDGSGKLKAGLNTTFGPGLEDINGGAENLNNKFTVLNDQMPALTQGISKLYLGSNNLTKGSYELFKGSRVIFKGSYALYLGSAREREGINELYKEVPALQTGVPQLYSGSNEAVDGIKKLYSGSNDALAGSKKLVSGQGDLKDGITTLNGKVPELKDGVTKLHDGSNELATKLKDGSNELNDGLVNTSQDMGTFVATPVNLEVAPINPVPNYGSGFSPYFINLSLWIGAIMMFFVISAKTEQYEGATKFDKAFGKFLSFGFVGILQAVLVGIVVLTLGLSPANMPLYFASLIFFSLVYIAIVQCLISLFGDAGRLLSIVLLILQLTACAGTFPLELVPRFFVVINPFMPFTYSVDALREICSASVINYGVLCKDYIILAIVLVVFLTISIAGATFGEKMQRVIEGRKSGMN
ncbi:YhgE/Pip domain-containing protein [Clostridium sp. SHJSY1]|uniref:YhgE/Pip domain-containing protein n=1 Tax=Clostridium sp. SHJSY1 TaxID=2942483 RepID=UPI0028771E73|nr:YhgE/Pip domain-containing protein [Clostridium sp. SHJSY1]MDS0524409.1 YhgE/Pip domain-containing protein [Clostridium sp. SHJSY1]